MYHDTSENGTQDHPADLQAVFNVIDQLPWDKDERVNVYDSDNDGHVAVRIVRFGEKRALGQLARSRSSALPLIDRQGVIEPLRLDDDESLFEASHFGIFWDHHHCVLVLEYNQHAPRHKRLGDYLKKKLFNHDTAQLDSAIFTPMVKKEALERMLQHEELGKLELTFHRNILDELAENEEYGDLYSAMQVSAQAAQGLDILTLGLRASTRNKRARKGTRVNWLQALATMIRNHADNFLKAQVEMYPEAGANLAEINLLSDKLAQSIVVPTLEGRAIDSQAMLDKIEELYDNNVDNLPKGF